MSNSNPLPVDVNLDRLRQPTDTAERMDILREFVEYWHGPILPGDGLTDDEIGDGAMPGVLRSWYRWAGRRSRIMSRDNTLLPPHELKEKEGKLVFYGENQWVYEWGTLISGDDPPVFGRYDAADPWTPENMTLSEHLILAAIFEAIGQAPYGAAAGCLPGDVLARLIERVPPIDIPPWGWLGPTQFYGRNGVFMYTTSTGTDERGNWYTVRIGAKSPQSLEFLKPYLGSAWEYVALE